MILTTTGEDAHAPLGSVYTGLVPFGTVPKWVRLGIAFTRDPLEPFQMELLAVPKRVHLRSRSHLEPYPEGISCKRVERFEMGTARK